VRIFTFDTPDDQPRPARYTPSPRRVAPTYPTAAAPAVTHPVSGGLTPRQSEVHLAMLRYQEEHGEPPTQSELSRLLGLRSEQGVKAHLVVLEAAGYVVNERKHGHRSKTAVWPSR
jgi:hypothetical protein